MKNSRTTYAVVGVGPRGLSSLESLVIALHQNDLLADSFITLFEETSQLGSGHVYDTTQLESNWININERMLELEPRKELQINAHLLPSFPSYHEWAALDYHEIPSHYPDTYPPRAKVGNYLSQRFHSLFNAMEKAGLIDLIQERVIDITLEGNKIKLTTKQDNFFTFDQVHLTIGHQSTEYDDQIKKWLQFEKDNSHVKLFAECYPIKNIIDSEHVTSTSNIALRGFGLSMIDAVRGIANKFGTFKRIDEKTHRVEYHSEHRLKDLFIAFSLDGLPVAPKPFSLEIDLRFKPSEKSIKKFEKEIGNVSTQANAKDESFLIDAIIPMVGEVYTRFETVESSQEEIERVSKDWLKDDEFKHPLLLSRDLPVGRLMEEYIEMALGNTDPSLDYCISHVWKHVHGIIYKQLSHSACSDEVMAKLIGLDERLKRYTYGPPIESLQQLYCLYQMGILNLDFVADPEIELSEKAWIVKKNGKQIESKVMINTVLDPPALKKVNSPIILSLLKDDLIQAVHDDLGVKTTAEAFLVNQEEQVIPISFLGRLAKGTVLGVDAIIECFGKRSDDWAKKASTFAER